MNGSWVKLYRKVGENIFLMKDDRAFNVFIKLLIFCNSSGQYANGRERMSETFGIHPSTLYKVLLRLEREQLITISSNSRYTTYSICNWSKYQQQGNSPNVLKVTAGEQPGNSPVTAGEHLSKNKNKNKNKNRTLTSLNGTRVSTADIDAAIAAWNDEVGLELGAIEKQRKAASKLIKERGIAKTIQLIKGVSKAADDRYAPRIADFPSLYRKQNDLILWGRKIGRSNNNSVEIIS